MPGKAGENGKALGLGKGQGSAQPAGQAPIATNDSFEILEDDFLNGNLILGIGGATPDSDPNADLLTVTEVNGETTSGDGIFLVTSDNGRVAELTVDADGTLSFDAQTAFNELAADEDDTLTFNYTISDTLFTDTATVTVAINGVNDVPIIGGDTTGNVTEDDDPTTLMTGGVLTIRDEDADQSTFVPQVSASDYGTFTLGATGVWSYEADNKQDAIQDLDTGDTLTDSFTAVSYDGTANQTVTVTINGVDDNPDIDVFATLGANGDQLHLNNGADETSGEWLGFNLGTVPGLEGAWREVALGDLDGDGTLDAVVPTDPGGFVLLNAGVDETSGEWLGYSFKSVEGTFVTSWGVALGDLDGDNDLDALISNSQIPQHEVWINDGVNETTGEWLGFSVETVGDTSGRSQGVALGDFDGDGHLDGIVTNANADNQVLYNKGFNESGEWRGFEVETIDAGTDPASIDVAVADLDRDGDLDAIVTNAQPDSANEVWINDGLGNFNISPIAGSEGYSWQIAIGDLDNDKYFDAIVQNDGQPDFVLLNNGSNAAGEWLGFSVETHTSIAWNGLGVALGDFDGDRDLDAYATMYGPEDNEVWINDGTGTFTPISVTGPEPTSHAVAVGDIDGDGTVPAVDENGLPNINQDGLLPSMYVEPDGFLV